MDALDEREVDVALVTQSKTKSPGFGENDDRHSCCGRDSTVMEKGHEKQRVRSFGQVWNGEEELAFHRVGKNLVFGS